MTDPTPLARLTDASRGLRFVSETDAPLVPFVWPDAEGEPTPDRVRSRGGHPPDAPTAVLSVADFFRAVPRADRPRFTALADTLAGLLGDVRAVKVGRVRMTVYLVGTLAGGWAGLTTEVVET